MVPSMTGPFFGPFLLVDLPYLPYLRPMGPMDLWRFLIPSPGLEGGIFRQQLDPEGGCARSACRGSNSRRDKRLRGSRNMTVVTTKRYQFMGVNMEIHHIFSF